MTRPITSRQDALPKRRTSRLGRAAVGAALGIALLWGGLGVMTPVTASAAGVEDTLEGVLDEAGYAEDDSRSELVYAIANASGAPQAIFVLDGGSAGSLVSSAGISDEDSEGGIGLGSSADVLDALEDSPLLFEGDLAEEFPWQASLTYYLDGVEVDPAELKGASGALAIELAVEPVPEGSRNWDYSQAYFLSVTGYLDATRATNVTADGMSVSTSANVTTVSTYVLPGESASWTIECDAEDFRSYGWQVAAMRLDADIDLSDYDLSEVTDAADELADATSQLAEGGTTLRESLELLSTGASTLSSGTGELASGASELSGGLAQLAVGTTALSSGIDQLARLSGSLEMARAALGELSSGLAQVRQAVGELSATVGANSDLSALLASVTSDGEALQAQLQATSAQLQTVASSLSQAESSAQSAATSAAAASSDADAAQAALDALLADGTLSPDDERVIELRQAIAASRTDADSALAFANAAATAAQDGLAAQSALAQAIDLDELSTLATQVSQLVAAVQSVYAQSGDATTDAAAFLAQADSLISTAQDGIAQLQAGAQAVADGTSAAADGARALAEGATALYQGTEELASGSSRLAEGSGTLEDGLWQLADVFDGLGQQIIDEAQEKIDDVLGADWEPRSFIDAGDTTVASVTFVLAIDGIE